LFGNGPSKLLRLVRFDSLPSTLDLRIGNLVLHGRRVCRLRLEDGSRCHHRQLVTPQGLTEVRLGTCHRRKGKIHLLDVPIGPGCHGLHRRTEVIDHIIVGGNNVSDILRLPDDLNISLSGLDVPGIIRLVPMRIADESVSSGSNAILRVRPGRDRSILRNFCLWR
jgi:hypothetical protein